MIYLDVTAGCLLPLQSGIPRTTRGLWRLLRESPAETTPCFWQPFRGRYTELSPRSRSLLENNLEPPSRSPRDTTLSLLWASLADLRFWPKTLPLHRIMKASDTLLLTSLFPDNRVAYLQRLLDRPGRKIAIFHDAIPLRDSNVSAWEKKRHVKTLRLLSRMDLVIAVSQSARDELHALSTQHGLTPPPTTVIPWPVPFEMARLPFTHPSQVFQRILYVSRLKQMKNHAALFDACEILWRAGIRFELELIGCEDEPRESREILRQLTRLQMAGRKVSWRAQVTESELHRAYQRATFTAFPSLMEGFGLPIIESLWHGRAVICGEHGAVGELARHGGCLTTDIKNVNALAAALKKLLQDPELCLTLAREAYARPVRTWADYGRDLLPLLEPR
jgi:glycosyltransferase involved in cell wall biosynthesis